PPAVPGLLRGPAAAGGGAADAGRDGGAGGGDVRLRVPVLGVLPAGVGAGGDDAGADVFPGRREDADPAQPQPVVHGVVRARVSPAGGRRVLAAAVAEVAGGG